MQSTTLNPQNQLKNSTTSRPHISRPCRSCWKIREEEHSLHLCLKQKRQEKQKEEDRKIQLEEFLRKNALTLKTKTSTIQKEEFIARYCSVWKTPQAIEPISALHQFKVPQSRLPFKKRILPVQQWHGRPHNNPTKITSNE